ILIFFSLILAIVGYLFQSNLIYLLSSGLISLVVVDFIFSIFAVRGVRIMRFCPGHASRGKEFTIKLRIESKSSTRYLLQITDGSFAPNLPGEKLPLISKLAQGQHIFQSYKKTIKARGIHTINNCVVESLFPLGIWKAQKTYPLRSEIIVYPEFFEAPQFNISYRGIRTEFANTTSSRPGTGGDFFDIREYQPGDSLKHIHWRATARAGKLMVKQLEKYTLSNLSIILDNSKELILGLGEESNFEYAIKTAATIANRALSTRYHVKFIYYDHLSNQIKSLKAYGIMTPILDILARIEPSENISIEKLIDKAEGEIDKESVAVFLLLTLSKEATSRIVTLTQKGIECVLILFNPRSFAAVIDPKVAKFYRIFSELMAQEAYFLSGKGIRIYMVNQGESISQALSRPYMLVNI
ncbi:MAG: hypothetical protein DRP73_04905, partial [Candidatus Omnitrophota bacterium]